MMNKVGTDGNNEVFKGPLKFLKFLSKKLNK